MAGETKQTAEIANLISKDLFAHFGWKRAGTSDHNFVGQPPPQEAKTKANDEAATDEPDDAADDEEDSPSEAKAGGKLKEYPADVVFWYDDPYYHRRTFIHFDLKSYGASSINYKTVVKALRRLSTVIAIADSSEDWSKKFAPNQSNFDINGALFVYNHDNKAGTRFSEFLQKIGPLTIPIPEKKCVYVFSPERISYLLSVANDMERLKGAGVLPRPDEGEISFFYPYGAKMKPQSNLLPHATAEVLVGPLIIVRHRFNMNEKQSGYILYYDGPGAEEEEFLFLFETILKRRLLTDVDEVQLRLARPASNAALVCRKAKEAFIAFYHELDIFRKQVDRIEYASVQSVNQNISTIELGME